MEIIALFPVLLLVGLALVGGLALVVGLAINPRTRPAGIVLGVVGGLLLCGMVALTGILALTRVSQDRACHLPAQRRAEAIEHLERTGEEPGSAADQADAEPAVAAGTSDAAQGIESADATGAQARPEKQTRPAWAESPPKRVGDGYQMSITIGPYTTRLECDAQVPAALQAALDEYLSIYLGPKWSGRIRLPADQLQARLVKDQWEETIQSSVGPMVQLHLLLHFDSQFAQTVRQLRDRAIVNQRLWLAGTGLGVVLAWLALAFAGLRIDEATAGAYRGRLVVGGVLAGVLVALLAGMLLSLAGSGPISADYQRPSSHAAQLRPAVAGVVKVPVSPAADGLAVDNRSAALDSSPANVPPLVHDTAGGLVHIGGGHCLAGHSAHTRARRGAVGGGCHRHIVAGSMTRSAPGAGQAAEGFVLSVSVQRFV